MFKQRKNHQNAEPPTDHNDIVQSIDFSSFRSPDLEIQPKPSLVEKYSAFRDALNPNVDVVYHPCCSTDSSPSAAFPDSRVIYVDWDPSESEDSMSAKTVEKLKKAGLEAYFADANIFDPGPVDVVILRNPGIESYGPIADLKPGGYAIVNDYHLNATQLHRMDEFELVGILHDRTPDHAPILDTENPEQYWQTVETDEELQCAVVYDGIGILARNETGTTTPTLQQLKDAIDRIKAEYPDAIEEAGALIYDNGTKVFPSNLPPKKGQLDDFFVFRRKIME